MAAPASHSDAADRHARLGRARHAIDRAAERGTAPVHVMTVLGPIDAETMGFTQPHEHVLIDHFNMRLNYEAILEDVGLATEEVQAYADAGGRTLVDTTNIGIERDPEGLAEVSRATGVNIVMGAGWYREAVYPPLVLDSPPHAPSPTSSSASSRSASATRASARA